MLIINSKISKNNFQIPTLDYRIMFYGYQTIVLGYCIALKLFEMIVW